MAKKNAIIESIHFFSSVFGLRHRTFIKAEHFLKKEDKELLEVSHFVHSEHVALARLWEGTGALGCVWVYLPCAECTFTFCKSEASACESDIWAAEVSVRRCLWFFFEGAKWPLWFEKFHLWRWWPLCFSVVILLIISSLSNKECLNLMFDAIYDLFFRL